MTRATSYGVAIAGALVLIGLGYWFATNFAQLSRSILPGMASSPSQSMEPYEVVLKFDISRSEGNKDQQVNTSPAEWRLKLPRAFIWSELGTNDSIGGGLKIIDFILLISMRRMLQRAASFLHRFFLMLKRTGTMAFSFFFPMEPLAESWLTLVNALEMMKSMRSFVFQNCHPEIAKKTQMWSGGALYTCITGAGVYS